MCSIRPQDPPTRSLAVQKVEPLLLGPALLDRAHAAEGTPRALEQARRSFEISEIGVRLAERRVEEQNLLAELGRISAQDLVDAQNDLVGSRNQRTQALVGHTIARLRFWSDLGILYIHENGQWEERDHANLQNQ